MNQYCVVVANGAQARFFTLETNDYPDLEHGPTLVETGQMFHPDHEPVQLTRTQRQHRDYTNSPRKNKANQDNLKEHDKNFANSIAKEMSRQSRLQKTSELVLVSQQRMLKQIKSAMPKQLKSMNLQELAKDLSKLSPQELHRFLAREKLIPERKTPTL